MAETVDGEGKPATGKKKGGAPKKTHNLEALKKAVLSCTKKFNETKDEQEEANGSFNLTIGHMIDSAAEAGGIPKAILRRELNRSRRRMKEEQAEKELELDEREDIERLRAAMDGTPFGSYFAGKLAEGAVH